MYFKENISKANKFFGKEGKAVSTAGPSQKQKVERNSPG